MSNTNRFKISYAKESTFGVTPGARAQVTLTLDTQPANADTMTLDSKVYTFQLVLTDVDGNIKIGADLATTQANIIAALNLDDTFGVAGTAYAASMTVHPTVFAGKDGESTPAWVNNTLIISAKTPGIAGNSIASTETFTPGTDVFSSGTLTGGVDQEFQEVRLTGESLHQETEHVTSAEIRDDRQIVDATRTTISAAGDMQFELSYKQYDDWFVSALESSGWSTPHSEINGATTISMSADDNSINDSGSGFTGGTNDYVANQWIKVSGFTNAANNGVFKIKSVTSTTMVLIGGPVVTEAAGNAITITMGGQILNGTTQESYSFLKTFTDLNNEYAILRGMTCSGVSLNVEPGGIVTGTFTWLGTHEKSNKYTLATSETAALTNKVIDGVDNVTVILETGTAYESTAFTLTLENNLRQRNVIGTLGPRSIGSGTINLTGTLQSYFESQAIMNKYLNDTATSLAIVFKDDDGNQYVLDLPRVKLTSGQRVAGGIDQDIIADMEFTAYRHPTENVTLRVARFDA